MSAGFRGLSLLLLSLFLAGCAPWDFACSAIGWSNTLSLMLAHPRAGVTLELCDGAGCTPGPSPDAGLVTAEPLVPIQPSVVRDVVSSQDAATGSPVPPASLPGAGSPMPPAGTGVMMIEGDGLRGWTADFVGGQSTIGYRVLDEAGDVVVEGEIDVDWVRVGGDERCGGPHEARAELPA